MRLPWLVATLIVFVACSPARGGEVQDLRTAVDLLGDRDPEKRERAVYLLEKVPGRTSLLHLLEALRDEDAGVRSRARTALGVRRSPGDLEILAARGVKHRDARVRLASLRALASADAPGARGALETALSDRSPGIREAAAGLTKSCSGGGDHNALAAAVSRGREGRPRAAALLALAECDLARTLALAGKGVDDRSFEVRVAALEILATCSSHHSNGALLCALDDRSWSVRLTAMRALAATRVPAAIPPLIGALREERGRLLEEAGNALAMISGVELPADPELWARWWREQGEGFAAPDAPAAPKPAPGESVATFSSIPFHSDCVAFVLDRSRSMRDRLERGVEKTKGDLVEEELGKTLARLRPPTRFFLVSFGTEVEAFGCRPVEASPASRARALEWFRKLRPRGRTNIFDALEKALSQADVDTVFLLTDGAPTAGEYRNRTEILTEVARLNRYRKAVIHTVEIGREATGKRWEGFLAQLAKASGGISVRR